MPIDFNSSGGAETFGSPYLRDYQHASLVFRSNNFQNAPKLKFLYHTYFEINPEAFEGFNRRGVGPIGPSTNFGVLVKQAQLPTYIVETDTMNQYNRKRIIQTRIKYNPIEITFHDDNGDQINQLWEAYYTYYYYDAMNPNVQFGGSRGSQGGGPNNYNQRNIYNDSIAGDSNWGYNSDSTSGSEVKVPFFKNITIFGFHQKKFVAYTLVNPIITNFTHDTYDYSSGDGTMQNRMTLEYETALYNYGELDGENPDNLIAGFGSPETYDRTLSPIASPGTNRNTNSVQGNRRPNPNNPFSKALSELGTGTGPFSAVGSLVANSLERSVDNLAINAQRELSSMLTEQAGTAFRNIPFFTPTPGSTPSFIGQAASQVIGTNILPSVVSDEPVAGSQYTGQNLTTGPRLGPPGGT